MRGFALFLLVLKLAPEHAEITPHRESPRAGEFCGGGGGARVVHDRSHEGGDTPTDRWKRA